MADRLGTAEPFVLTFGGQGAGWFEQLRELVADGLDPEPIARCVNSAQRRLAPVAAELSPALPLPFLPHQWLTGDQAPTDADLLAPALSLPGVLLTQMATLDALRAEGLDLRQQQPSAAIGHSQGLLGVAVLAGRRQDSLDSDVELLTIARLIGAASALVARRTGLATQDGHAPMLAISGIGERVLRELLAQVAQGESTAPVLAGVNGPRRFLVSGSPAGLARLRAALEARRRESQRQIEQKRTGGPVFDPLIQPVACDVAFHHPALAPAVDLVRQWAGACGVNAEIAAQLAEAICIEPISWPSDLLDVIQPDTRWVIDVGPSNVVANLTSRTLRGRGVTVIPAGTRTGRDDLFTPGASIRREPSWQRHQPRLIDRGDGRAVLDTAFTRRTGRSPILLAGMTPTTVDPGIVAAAANAGYWAELAGGGQVTADVLAANLARLGDELQPGRTAQFNALFLDPYLWQLQLGNQRLVQKARAAGAAVDGVVISAGIPELEDAVAIVTDLQDAGFAHIAFKPGTIAQVHQVIAIAAALQEARPGQATLIVQIEGGAAGGHHSWEDLDTVLLATYHQLRAHPNLVICVGGGIGTPDRAADYLLGRWSLAYDEPAMPLDGVLIGTAAMACREATTSDQVKQLLVDTPGLAAGSWVGAGRSAGGMTSGRSQLGADLHEIDNTAARCGRLLDEVAGNADAVAARREELIAAMAATAKPYFGDVAAMTYAQWLARFVALTTTDAGQWVDVSWRDRFAELLDRSVARLHEATSGVIERPAVDLEHPAAALAIVGAEYPEADTCLLHPADVAFFVDVCRRPGKPVPFVPVIDADVRRWWRSDSLWQAHDDRYPADAVVVIPGPVAVGGITQVDEPIADLLGRCEDEVVNALTSSVGADAPVTPATSRTSVGEAASLLDAALDAHDVVWSGRVVPNPLRRLGAASDWIRHGDRAELPSPLAEVRPEGAQGLRLLVRFARGTLEVAFDLSAMPDGGLPIVDSAQASDAMAALLSLTAGGALPRVVDGVAHQEVRWSADHAADHTGASSPAARATGSDAPGRSGADSIGLLPESVVPDASLRVLWPVIFASLGAARTDSGQACVEGLLDLVHLDHRLDLTGSLPRDGAPLRAQACLQSVHETTAGRVVDIHAELRDEQGPVVTLRERFLIRGRTGAAELPAPMPLTSEAVATPRSHLARVRVSAPRHLSAFAAASGDHNPLHTELAAARLAGLEAPIVHGMWLSAVAQRMVSRIGARRQARSLTGWLARWIAPINLGDEVDIEVHRVGVSAGRSVVEVSCRSGGQLVMTAEAILDAPATVYAFPGQGIQHRGMGMQTRSASAAARQVWDRADAHTRAALGFSILAVVRDNPTQIRADGQLHRHPDGVLFLTQFTQVAMATVAVAEVAHLREAGVFVENAVTCGHSVGEYNALAAVTGILPLEALLEIVFRRGMAMHKVVPRDSAGRSNYRLAVIRPSLIGLPDEQVAGFVADVAASCGEFIQVVNENVAGAQYAVAGTVAGLSALEEAVAQARREPGGKPAFILIPGIDVPFHSAVLRDGVPEFRDRLDALLPDEIDPDVLIGRYIPNLVPKPFSLSAEYITEVADLVDSAVLHEVLADWDDASADRSELARTLLIELLAWQFASPVRWIETQALLFTGPETGGLGMERFIEVGVASAPTVANLAAQTLKRPEFAHTGVHVLNTQRDAMVVLAQDVAEADGADAGSTPADSSASPTSSTPSTPSAPTAVAAESVSTQAVSAQAVVSPVAANLATPGSPVQPAERPDDLAFTAAHAVRYLAALWTKTRPEAIAPTDSIESLCEGVSSRRNQLLVDLGAELGLGAIDDAADADWTSLSATVDKLARTYRPFGPVLTEAIGEPIRRFAAGLGAKPTAVADRVQQTWGLGAGWVAHVSADLAAGIRAGNLGYDIDLDDLNTVVDHAVACVATAQGVAVTPLTSTAANGVAVDSAALDELTDHITGPDGVLASTARHLLTRLGQGAPDHGGELAEQAEATEELRLLMEQELGSGWAQRVRPAFDARRAVLFDDRWASIREDLARIWTGDQAARRRCFATLDDAALRQARWWQARAKAEGRADLEAFYANVPTTSTPPPWQGEVAIVTGAAPDSIAASLVAQLLRGGATVVATSSRLDADRMAFFRRLYRDQARAGAALWVVPANLASWQDIDALVEWVGQPVTETAAGVASEIRPALHPSLVFPFAAPSVYGSAADVGPRAELDFRVLVWGVERLVTGLAELGAEHRLDQRVHVVLPGSPNRGRFGGDGCYGEAKAAFDAFVTRWHAETAWSARVSMAHAMIGWVRGTNLMGHNDHLVNAVRGAGVRTFSPHEMATQLLSLCREPHRSAAAAAPVVIDLTGGLAQANLDLAALARATTPASAMGDNPSSDDPANDDPAQPDAGTPPLQALTHPAGWRVEQPTIEWPEVTADLADLVVVVAAGEVGPCGSSRTRFELEVEDRLSPAGVLELAWTTGLIVWEHSPVAGWHDAATGEQLSEADVVDRFGEQVEAACGIRSYRDDGALVDGTAPLLASVFLEEDTSFVVRTQAEAQSFAQADPARTAIRQLDSGDWQVTRKAGSQIRVPRRYKLSRFVGAQVPDGFDPGVWGLGSMVDSVDRLAAWNLVATVDAFISAGFEPAELLRWIHPTRLANTQGTGIGGIRSTRAMYVDALLGEQVANDILQEALPNVIAAHTVQSYLGSYGSMVHPVAACATAAVSIEEAVDKIRLDKASVVVAGGFDDLGVEGIVGFANMSATADTASLLERGIEERRVCRPNDRRRAGFIEGQGGGTIVLARGDIAAQLGLPVLGVLAYAGSFADGIHTSIPAPGMGALGAGCGGVDSPLGRALAGLGLSADDIAVVSKHDTSTKANDPNESDLHERLAAALGRSSGAPLYVVSQKSLTGHAKGGAAAFQVVGMCQIMRDGVIPPNRSLDCVDEALAKDEHMVWLREPLRTRGPVRAGLVTSLGFGHVSAVIALAHPAAFVAAIAPQDRQAYLDAAQARLVQGQARLLDAMCGGQPLYRKPAGRRFAGAQSRTDEAALLVDPNARLSCDGVYPQADQVQHA